MPGAHRDALPTGYRLEEYGIDRLLGAGGFGITYLATDQRLDGPVAIKEYFPHEHAARGEDDRVVASSTESREVFVWGLDRFLQEARSIHRFRHPNVVRVHRYFEANDTAYIVMEYIEGESLAAILEERPPLAARDWRRWLDRLLDGLAHVHGHGYLHRDIKPSNIIVRASDDEPVLIDFGATRAAAHDRAHTKVLTPAYAPLEQHGTEARSESPVTDIYALAAVTYRALTGALPPSAPDRAVEDRYEPLAGRVPGAPLPWLREIDHALALRGPDRPQTIAAWRAALHGAGVPESTAGASVTDLARPAGALRERLAERTCVGIDFGTSTTVVSIARFDDKSGAPTVEPLPIAQYDEGGRRIDNHLVPSRVAWHDGRLLVGRGVSAHLQPALREGENLWSSFKMRFGIDLGPQYPNTELPRGRETATIERPQDAAAVFFEHLRKCVERHIADRALAPPAYAVSVPASFEANQRRDLIRSLEAAGIAVDDAALIDEPNAAFLSYFFEAERAASGPSVARTIEERARRVLVFDFGAGTCDISVLEVEAANRRLWSRNLAISKFLALGGDDIDRAIARQVLLPELCAGAPPEDVFTTAQLDQAVLPRLKPSAEELKNLCAERAEHLGICNPSELSGNVEVMSATHPVAIKLRDASWTLNEPSMTLQQFGEIMQPFLAEPASAAGDGPDGCARSVLAPIASALDKADITREDLDMVLFIGGSAESPLVRGAVKDYVGRFVDCVTPQDLRAHVSQGAALHALFFHGLGEELIRPVTSEPIYVVTRDDNLTMAVDAGSPVPSPVTITTLTVEQDRQPRVELPFCVGGRDKLIAVVTVRPPSPPGHFAAGQTVRISSHITREKLLEVRVHVAGAPVAADVLNPLANAELLPQRRRLLQARQALNESILAGRGRPTPEAVLTYAHAAQEADRWREAAEMYEAAERLDPESDHAISVTYNYARAGDRRRAADWALKAHEREPSCVTAYNCAALNKPGEDRARLLDESLRLDPDYSPALIVYGEMLRDDGDARGLQRLRRAFDLLKAGLERRDLTRRECDWLERAAAALGKKQALGALEEYRTTLEVDDSPVREDYLAAGPPRRGAIGPAAELEP